MSCRLCHVSTASVSEQPLHHHPGSVAGVPDSYAPPACNDNLPSAFRKIITRWIKRSPAGRRTILVATFSIYVYFGNFCVLCLWKSIHHLPPLSAACPGVSLLAVGLYTAFCPYGTLLFLLLLMAFLEMVTCSKDQSGWYLGANSPGKKHTEIFAQPANESARPPVSCAEHRGGFLNINSLFCKNLSTWLCGLSHLTPR